MRTFAASVAVVLALTGCEPAPLATPSTPSVRPQPMPAATRPAPETASTTAPSAPTVMATVNGQPIYMAQLVEPLVEAHGLQLAEMLIANRLVAQEARRLSIEVTESDVAEENARALRDVLGAELTPQQRDQLLTKLLHSRGLTRGMWRRIMWRNARLRKMARPRVRVTEPMLKEQYARHYAQKVQVRHIQLPSLTEAQKIIRMLSEGGDFAELARRYSTNTTTARKGGLLPPFTRGEQRVPKAVRDAAFDLSEGEVSGIVQAGSEFQVLKLVRRITPPEADYEKVKEKLREELTDRLVERVQAEILAQLRRAAAVEYVDPTLRKAQQRLLETGGGR